MRDDRARLLDILHAIEAIRRHTGRGRAAFDEDELVQVWVLHHLRIIGEAARGLGDATIAGSTVPWRSIVGMRTLLVHRYFAIDRELVWNVVAHELDALETEVRRLLAGSGA